MSKIRLLALALLANMAVACMIDPLPAQKKHDAATEMREDAGRDSGTSLDATSAIAPDLGPNASLDSGAYADTGTGTGGAGGTDAFFAAGGAGGADTSFGTGGTGGIGGMDTSPAKGGAGGSDALSGKGGIGGIGGMGASFATGGAGGGPLGTGGAIGTGGGTAAPDAATVDTRVDAPPALGGSGGTGGATATGGTTASGGSASGGGTGTGGALGGTGGTATGGGATGGSAATGGTATGGSTPTGGTTGGASATGGTTTPGGTPASGGITTSGGVTTSGGITTSGGVTTSGGITTSGGVTTSGGITTSGGVTTSGGITTSGGTTTNGGTTTAGGTTANGGTTTAGGTTTNGGTTTTGGTTTGGSTSCPTVEKLNDPNFDITPSGWTESGTYAIVLDQSLTPVTANTQPKLAWLGGQNSYTDSLSQTITLPSTFPGGILSFYYIIGTAEGTTTAYDFLTIKVTNTSGTLLQTVGKLSNMNQIGTWTKASFGIDGALAGQTVVLVFTATNDYSNNTNFFIDTASFSTINCPTVLNYGASCDGGIGAKVATSYMGQTFTPTTNTLKVVSVALSEVGTLGPITIQLKKVSDGTLLASWGIDVPANTSNPVSVTYIPYFLPLSPPLTVGPTDSYRIVFMPNASVSYPTSETYWSFRTAATPPYSGGDAQYSDDSGSTWHNFSGVGADFIGTFFFETF